MVVPGWRHPSQVDEGGLTLVAVQIDALDNLTTLPNDWSTHLRGRNRSIATIASYTRCAVSLRAFLVDRGMPTNVAAITREHVETFLAHLADRVSLATTANHYRSLRQLFHWPEDDREISRSAIERIEAAAVPVHPVPIVTDDQVTTFKCNTFDKRRDGARMRLPIDTGIRAGS